MRSTTIDVAEGRGEKRSGRRNFFFDVENEEKNKAVEIFVRAFVVGGNARGMWHNGISLPPPPSPFDNVPKENSGMGEEEEEEEDISFLLATHARKAQQTNPNPLLSLIFILNPQ